MERKKDFCEEVDEHENVEYNTKWNFSTFPPGEVIEVRKTLGLLSQNPKHPGLNSHKREAEKGPRGEDIWESYVENNTPSAWRVFWYYGPESGTITVFAITPHP